MFSTTRQNIIFCWGPNSSQVKSNRPPHTELWQELHDGENRTKPSEPLGQLSLLGSHAEIILAPLLEHGSYVKRVPYKKTSFKWLGGSRSAVRNVVHGSNKCVSGVKQPCSGSARPKRIGPNLADGLLEASPNIQRLGDILNPTGSIPVEFLEPRKVAVSMQPNSQLRLLKGNPVTPVHHPLFPPTMKPFQK